MDENIYIVTGAVQRMSETSELSIQIERTLLGMATILVPRKQCLRQKTAVFLTLPTRAGRVLLDIMSSPVFRRLLSAADARGHNGRLHTVSEYLSSYLTATSPVVVCQWLTHSPLTPPTLRRHRHLLLLPLSGIARKLCLLPQPICLGFGYVMRQVPARGILRICRKIRHGD